MIDGWEGSKFLLSTVQVDLKRPTGTFFPMFFEKKKEAFCSL